MTPEDAASSPAERLLLAGDTHGDLSQIRYLLKMAAEMQIDRIVQVGDFGYWPHMAPFHERVDGLASAEGVEFYWLDGNHENFDALEQAVDFDATEPQAMGESLWYLPRGSTWQWGGCRFMALGGAYSIDKDYRTEGRSWWRQEMLTHAQVYRALDRGPVDVLLTHDAPEGACPIITPLYKGDEESRGNRLAVTAVMEAVQPRLLVHGHYHHRYSAKQGRTQIEGLGRDGMGRDSWLVIEPEKWTQTTEVGHAAAS